MGNIHQVKFGTMRRVLHVPDLRAYIISSIKSDDDTGHHFRLANDNCFLCDKVSRSRMSLFRREDGLLYLDDPLTRCLSSIMVKGAAKNRVLMMHSCMGHPPFELLRTYPSIFGEIEISTSPCDALHPEAAKLG